MMNLTRADRRHGRPGKGCLPRLETLETRQLLTGNQAIDGLIGASATRAAYNVDGSGLSAAMIDTGVDYTIPALGGGFGPGFKVVDGYDFSKNVANPYPVNSHGTSTAAIVAANDPTYPGVAPGANIVALRVFGDDGSGDFDTVARALQYAIDHHTQDNISVVNISISDGGNYAYDFFSHDNSIGQRLAGLIHQLDLLNIPVVAAAGNSFTGTPGMGFPAILSETESVAATNKDDQFLGNAQRLDPADGFAAATDVVAPGADFTTITGYNSYGTVEGSSFAAPIVTGGMLLLQQIYEKWYGTLPKVDDLMAWIKGGATTIHDSATNADYGRINILKAASLIPRPPATPPTGDGPLTQVYVDGSLQATVPSTTAANPLSDFGVDAGFHADFNLIQTWQNGQSATIVPGSNAGTDLGAHFTKVEIYNPQPAGKVTPIASPVAATVASPVAATTPNDPTPASSTIGHTVMKAFHTTYSPAHKRLPRPSVFARGHHTR
jgi:Subtilase family